MAAWFYAYFSDIITPRAEQRFTAPTQTVEEVRFVRASKRRSLVSISVDETATVEAC